MPGWRIKMECPRCGSHSVAVSHRRGIEKYIRSVLPFRPYRCKECWSRFWKYQSPFKTLLGKLIAGAAILLILAIVVVPLAMMKIKANANKNGFFNCFSPKALSVDVFGRGRIRKWCAIPKCSGNIRATRSHRTCPRRHNRSGA